jgi:hypothetical protein
MSKQFKLNTKMKKDKRITQLHCTNCNAPKNPKNRIISLLGGQAIPIIAAQCNKCRTVMLKPIEQKVFDDMLLGRYMNGRFKFRTDITTLDEYRAKYDILAVQHTIRQKHNLYPKAPIDMLFELEAEQFLGFKTGTLQQFRIRKTAPFFYEAQGKIIYWKENLIEWKKDFKQRNDL